MSEIHNMQMTAIGPIPSDWTLSTLGDIGEVKMCKRVMKSQTLEKGDIPFFKIGTFGSEPDAYISKELFDDFKTSFSYPRKGSVLLSAAGTIGRAVEFDGRDAYFQDSNIVWIDNDEKTVLNKYLFYFYRIAKWKTENGGIVVRLYNENLKGTQIAFPPSLSEQKRIADALSRIDELISKLNQAIEKKRHIKEGLMQNLLTGRTRLPGFNEEWIDVRLGDVCMMNSGGTPSTSDPHFYGGDILFLSISDMTNSGKYIYSTEKRITEDGYNCSSARMFPAGTLMYAMYASLGKCAITKVDVAVSQAILGFHSLKNIDTEYLYYYLASIEESVKQTGQTGTQSNLSKNIVENFHLSIPSLEEQQAIASLLRTVDDDIDSCITKREKYNLIKQGMMQNLLTGNIRLYE